MIDEPRDRSQLRPPEVLLLQQQAALLRSETIVLLWSRSLALGLLLFASVGHTADPFGLTAVALAATLLGVFASLAIAFVHGRRLRLEELIMQEYQQHGGENWWKAVFAEWQQDAWRHPLRHRLLRIEPLIWAFTTVGLVVFRLVR